MAAIVHPLYHTDLLLSQGWGAASPLFPLVSLPEGEPQRASYSTHCCSWHQDHDSYSSSFSSPTYSKFLSPSIIILADLGGFPTLVV